MDFWKNYKQQYTNKTIKIFIISLLFSAVLSSSLIQLPLWFFAIFILLDMIFLRIDKYLTMVRLNWGDDSDTDNGSDSK